MTLCSLHFYAVNLLVPLHLLILIPLKNTSNFYMIKTRNSLNHFLSLSFRFDYCLFINILNLGFFIIYLSRLLSVFNCFDAFTIPVKLAFVIITSLFIHI